MVVRAVSTLYLDVVILFVNRRERAGLLEQDRARSRSADEDERRIGGGARKTIREVLVGRRERDRELERESMMHAMIISEDGRREKESGSENENMATIVAEDGKWERDENRQVRARVTNEWTEKRRRGRKSQREREREREKERGREVMRERAGESTSWKETDRGDARGKESQRVLTKLTGADLRRNLTNSGLNPPTRAVDLSCLPLNLAAVLAGWTRRWTLFFLSPVDLCLSFFPRCTAFPLLGSSDCINAPRTRDIVDALAISRFPPFAPMSESQTSTHLVPAFLNANVGDNVRVQHTRRTYPFVVLKHRSR